MRIHRGTQGSIILQAPALEDVIFESTVPAHQAGLERR